VSPQCVCLWVKSVAARSGFRKSVEFLHSHFTLLMMSNVIIPHVDGWGQTDTATINTTNNCRMMWRKMSNMTTKKWAHIFDSGIAPLTDTSGCLIPYTNKWKLKKTLLATEAWFHAQPFYEVQISDEFGNVLFLETVVSIGYHRKTYRFNCMSSKKSAKM